MFAAHDGNYEKLQWLAEDQHARFDPLVPTVFHEPWWLDAASGGRYEEVTVSSGGRTVGRLPYLRKSRLGFSICVAPELTLYLGPAISAGNGSLAASTIKRHQITRELIEKLPPFSLFHQQMHRGIPDALPFAQHDFKVLAKFSYEVAPSPEATIWRNMRDKTRNVIRRAQERSELVDLEPAAFLSVYEANLERRGRFFNYMYRSNAAAIFDATLSRGRGRLLGARDESGTVAAAIFYVWDDAVTYYMLTTRTPGSHNGIVSMLLWEAIRESAAHGRVFDFGAIGTAGSVLFYSAFGGEVRPRFLVERITHAYTAARASLMMSRELLSVRRLGLRSVWPGLSKSSSSASVRSPCSS
jgi:hypothetical protein